MCCYVACNCLEFHNSQRSSPVNTPKDKGLALRSEEVGAMTMKPCDAREEGHREKALDRDQNMTYLQGECSYKRA